MKQHITVNMKRFKKLRKIVISLGGKGTPKEISQYLSAVYRMNK